MRFFSSRKETTLGIVLKGERTSIELGSSTVGVGGSLENQLILADDSQVSWLHAKIYPQEQGYIVIDLVSTNGTFLNEKKIPSNIPHQLNIGDIVRFGNTAFCYKNETSEHQPTVRGVPEPVSLQHPNVKLYQQAEHQPTVKRVPEPVSPQHPSVERHQQLHPSP